MLDLKECAAPAHMLDLIADRLRADQAQTHAQHPHTDEPPVPLLACGARPESWSPPCWPTREALDRATGKRPFLAWCFDYHAIMANTPMLGLADIRADQAPASGGLIGTDATGALTGVVYEHAAHRVWNALPALTDAQFLANLQLGLTDLGATFAEIHDLKSEPRLGLLFGRALDTLAAQGITTPACVRLFPLLADLDEVLTTRASWECDRLRLAGAKIFVDGTLNSRTAWMLGPYADASAGSAQAHPQGTPTMTSAQIEDAIRRCDAVGLPLAAHAIGDAAVRAVLDAIEKVQPSTPGLRIEHAEVIDKTDVPRFAKLGVIASVQPCHLLYDIEALHRALPDRLDRVLPLRELVEAGSEPGTGLIFGSDTPIVRPNPADSILAATARSRDDSIPGMSPTDPVGFSQAITRDEAWAAFAVR